MLNAQAAAHGTTHTTGTAFKCSSHITNHLPTPTKLNWHCRRDQGRERVRFREIVLD
jgi:hypothetical protein